MPIATTVSPQAAAGSNSQAAVPAGKGKATGNTTNSFTQLLNGQINAQTDADPAETSDQAASMAGLLHMLQCLIMPQQNLQLDGANADAGETQAQPVSEMLLQVMNNNPALAGQLLKDPQMKQWFEQAEQLLATLLNTSGQPVFTLPSGTDAQGADALNLQAQNMLLTLATLSKQQPDNPILQYLNNNLEQSIEPVLPQLVASLKADANPAKVNDNLTQADEESPNAGKSEVHAGNLHTIRKHAANANLQQQIEVSANTIVQPIVKSKLEMLALKNAMNVPVIQPPAEDIQPAVQQELTTDTSMTTNPMMSLTDLQKAQLAATPLEKSSAPTMNAANFSEEMTEHVLKNMKITLAGGISEAKISLFPKNLGHIDVRLTMHDGQLVAHFAAETLAGKQMLESQLPQLRQALQTQGLQVEKLEVTQNANMQSSMFQDGRQGQQSSNQSQRQNKNRSIDFDSDSGEFNQEIESAAQTRAAVYGNSMDVIA